MSSIDFEVIKKRAQTLATLISLTHKQPFTDAVAQLEDAIKEADIDEIKKAIAIITPIIKNLKKPPASDFREDINNIEAEIKKSSGHGNQLLNIKISSTPGCETPPSRGSSSGTSTTTGSRGRATNEQGRPGSNASGTSTPTGSRKRVTNEQKKPKHNDRHEVKRVDESFPPGQSKGSGNSEEGSKLKKLTDVKEKLKDALEKFAQHQLKDSSPKTLEDELAFYAEKGTENIKEQGEFIKARVSSVEASVNKLLQQIDKEDFNPEPLESKYNETKEVNKKLKDVCMKLKAKKQENMEQLQKLKSDFEALMPTLPSETRPKPKKNGSTGTAANIQEVSEYLQTLHKHAMKQKEDEHADKNILDKLKQTWQNIKLDGDDNQGNKSKNKKKTDIPYSKMLDDIENHINFMEQEADRARAAFENEKRDILDNLKQTWKIVVGPNKIDRSETKGRKSQELSSSDLLNDIESHFKSLQESANQAMKQKDDEHADKDILDKLKQTWQKIKLDGDDKQGNKAKNKKKTDIPYSNMLEDIENHINFMEQEADRFQTAVEKEQAIIWETWQDIRWTNKIGGNETKEKKNEKQELSSAYMLKDITDYVQNLEKKATKMENEKTEQNDQQKEFNELMTLSLDNLQSILQEPPLKFLIEKGFRQSRNEDFDKVWQQLLSKAFYVQDTITAIAKRLKYDIREKDDKLAEMEKKIAVLSDEKQNLMMRLSKIAGANLMDNNPNIADLSDTNRPTNLSKNFSELYDNQWTNVFELLEKTKMKETDIISFLLQILQDVFGVCEKYARRQNVVIRTVLVHPTAEVDFTKLTKDSKDTAELPAVLSRGVTDLRKQSFNECSKDIINFLSQTKKKWFQKEAVTEYTVHCVELCWLMQMQTPPLHIDTETHADMKFDKNKYKEYTKMGKNVEFLVWPALLLHKDGPLLSKGVAQGK